MSRIKEVYDKDGIYGVLRGIHRFVAFKLLHRRTRDRYYSIIRYYINNLKYDVVASPYKTLRVQTDNIKYKNVGQKFPGKQGHGYIKGGDWDTNKSKVTNIKLYSIYRKRFVKNIPWEKTGIIEKAKNSIDKSGNYYNYTNIKDVRENRLKYIDELYNSIKIEGYKSQKGGAKNFTDTIKHQEHDELEILVNISRNGEILFYKGHNRMMLAKIIGVDEIPVQVMARHEQWQRIREQVAAGEFDGNLDCDWELEDHPDLQDVL